MKVLLKSGKLIRLLSSFEAHFDHEKTTDQEKIQVVSTEKRFTSYRPRKGSRRTVNWGNSVQPGNSVHLSTLSLQLPIFYVYIQFDTYILLEIKIREPLLAYQIFTLS